MGKMLSGATKGYLVPKLQADAVLDQANPTSDLEYDILATSANVRLIGINCAVTWTVQPVLNLWIYVDGVTYKFTHAGAVSTTLMYPNLNTTAAPAGLTLATTESAINKAFLLEGRSVKVTAEAIGGTVQNLNGRVRYAKW